MRAISLLISAVTLASPGCQPEPAPSPPPAPPEAASDQGLAAFETVYSVLQHPRCLNCHPAGDRPLQHDDSRPHGMNVLRGPDDAGHPALKCSACHQQANQGLAHLPPGNPAGWRLAPREMAFEGRSPRALALQLKDPAQSHMTLEASIAHVRDDALVGWGWDPGPGRAAVPVPRAELVAAFQTWVEAGAPVPADEEEAR